MSKSHTHALCRVMHDVQTMSIEELEEQYGIEVDRDDGTVWDPCEYKSFDDIHEWATYMQQLEQEDDVVSTPSFVKTGGKHRYDDDY